VADNRRTSTRHAVSLTGQLALTSAPKGVPEGEPKPVTVVNLSLGGALIAAGMRLAMGQRVQIVFSVPTAPDAVEVGAVVRWSDDKATGLQFDGLRARDVWALNKFFEQLPPLP
jgi:hypothetical protein